MLLKKLNKQIKETLETERKVLDTIGKVIASTEKVSQTAKELRKQIEDESLPSK